MTKQFINHSKILRMTHQEAAAVYKKCVKTLHDPEYQRKVVAESAKRGLTKEEALEQARNICEAIEYRFPGVEA